MHKRLLTLLTILSLSSVLLIGCGSPQGTPNQSETITEETEKVSEETTPKDTEEVTPEATEAPTPEPTTEPTPEPTAEPTPEPTAEPTPEPTAEPTPKPQIVYTYTDMTATMYATQTVNVRNLPSTDGEKVGSLSTNQEVTVIGQCNETGWYMFDYNGQNAFVSNKYLSTEKVEVQQAPPAQETAPVTSNVPRAADYPEDVWHDMGEYFFLVVSPSADGKVYTDEGSMNNVKAILEERYPGNWWGVGGFYLSDGRSVFVASKYNSASCNAFWDANSR